MYTRKNKLKNSKKNSIILTLKIHNNNRPIICEMSNYPVLVLILYILDKAK